MQDLYQALGVPENATYEQIRNAFHAIALDSHPDRNAGDLTAEERFKQASNAYHVLFDPIRRGEYDRIRRDPVLRGGWRGFNRAGDPVCTSRHLLSEHDLKLMAEKGRLGDLFAIAQHLSFSYDIRRSAGIKLSIHSDDIVFLYKASKKGNLVPEAEREIREKIISILQKPNSQFDQLVLLDMATNRWADPAIRIEAGKKALSQSEDVLSLERLYDEKLDSRVKREVLKKLTCARLNFLATGRKMAAKMLPPKKEASGRRLRETE